MNDTYAKTKGDQQNLKWCKIVFVLFICGNLNLTKRHGCWLLSAEGNGKGRDSWPRISSKVFTCICLARIIHFNFWDLIVMSLNCLVMDVMFISTTLPLSSLWSPFRALYILFGSYKSVHMVTGSSWMMCYFNLRWTEEATVSKVLEKGLSIILL